MEGHTGACGTPYLFCPLGAISHLLLQRQEEASLDLVTCTMQVIFLETQACGEDNERPVRVQSCLWQLYSLEGVWLI